MIKLNRLFIFVALLLNCAIPYSISSYDKCSDADIHSIIISDMVGESIDSLERRQFDLFPAINGFESAVIYQIGKDDPEYKSGYVVEITLTDGKKHRSVNRDPWGILLLRDYLSDYDNIKTERANLMRNRKVLRYIRDTIPIYDMVKDPFEIKWHIVDYDDDLGLPITSAEIAFFNKKKTNTYAYGCGCCLTSCVFGVIFWEINVGMNDYHNSSAETPITLGTMAGVLAATGAGFSIGISFDKSETIKAINNGRKLRVVD